MRRVPERRDERDSYRDTYRDDRDRRLLFSLVFSCTLSIDRRYMPSNTHKKRKNHF